MSELAVRVEHLSKRYRIGAQQARYRTLRESLMERLNPRAWKKREDSHIWALDDVSFEIKQGEVVGVIGRNGAGKSTLLKILAHITNPTKGRVEIHGRVGSLLEVGTGFHPELTGRDNIYLNGAILGMKRAEIDRKFDEIVAFAEIEKFLDTPAKHYSSGMYMRLAFAVAAHLEPEILLVDEVLAVGDAEFQKKCLGKMGEVAQEGRTVLFVSHNMAAVENLCRYCILLKTGQLNYWGDTFVTIEKYVNELHDMEDYPINHYRQQTSYGKKIVDIITYSNLGFPQNKFKMNDDVIIEILFDEEIQKTRNPYLGIGINNSKGERVFTLMSYDGVTSKNWLNCNKVRCIIPNINLMPGQYFLKIQLNYGNNIVDTILNYPGFEIVEHDFFGSGKIPNYFQGVIVKKADWEYI